MAAQKKASDEQRKKEGIMNQQAAEDTALFNKQYYQDLTKRTEIQNMLRILDQNKRKADTAVAARAAVTGATPEQQLAGREVNRRAFADAVADIASNASQLRDQYLRDYQGQRNRYYAQRLGMQDQLAAIHANTANQWANAATNAFAAGGQMLASGLGGLQGGKAPTVAADPVMADKANIAAHSIASPQDEFMQRTAQNTNAWLENYASKLNANK